MSYRMLRRVSAALLMVLAAAAGAEQGYSDAWGPAIGTEAPAISAPDQDGQSRDLDSLGEENGLLFLFARSADW